MLKFFYTCFYKPVVQLYLRFPVRYSHKGFKLKVLPGVFHPGFFFSSTYFFEFISSLDLKGRRFLEIGSGSGLLSLLAFKKGALVTALDKDPKAVENTQLNFRLNFGDKSGVNVIQSDLFSSLPPQAFDVIVINPPYFFKVVETDLQLAWYCGANGEYFQSLFAQLGSYIASGSAIYMILADNCDIERIRAIAGRSKICFTLVERKKIRWEENFIFELRVE